jgi:uncharacterized membrane protein YdcZ (DUF606 family)
VLLVRLLVGTLGLLLLAQFVQAGQQLLCWLQVHGNWQRKAGLLGTVAVSSCTGQAARKHNKD